MRHWRVLVVVALMLSPIGADILRDNPLSAQTRAIDGASTGMITLDGMTIQDISPLPAYVPIPSTNLSYDQKVDLGRQLYFDGRLSKGNGISCAFCHNPGTGFADTRQFSIVQLVRRAGDNLQQSTIQLSIPFNSGTVGPAL